ncbi:hypothetical protein [Sphingomonas sp. CCH18-H6]|uniref:hypothetical protein n=2 Tax=unclassified Sphingomonas TaxID=196159 RepID=UPI000ADB1220|nr:hypothetical protein [Sphingomonas sp. CCH18-H6]
MANQNAPEETPAVPLPVTPAFDDAALATPPAEPTIDPLAADTAGGDMAMADAGTSDGTRTSKAREAVREQAEKLTGKATEQARGFAAQGKERATGVLDELARMIDDAAGTVDERVGEQYGRYARSAAGAVSGLAENLRGKEVDEIVDDVREFVRKSPAVAIGTAAAVGFVLARILRSGFDGEDGRRDA